jgi:glycosyltransferase involved in cell wall biosynthesis
MPTLVSVFGVEPSRIGGTETFARELSKQLGELGWNAVLCFDYEPTPEVSTFLEMPNVRVEVLGRTSPTKHLRTVLRTYRPEILHIHFKGFVSVWPWLARSCGVKKIFFTDHSSRSADHVPERAPFWKRLSVRIINFPVTKVICVSKYGYRSMKTLDLLENNRYELIYNGVDLSRVCPDASRGINFRKRFGVPENKQVVTQISWIIPEKGILDLLDTAKNVTDQTSDVHFIIVGDGPYLGEYVKKAESMGLGNSVTWTGLIADPFAEGVYDAADVICQLSRWQELFGWMIAEGMAYEKPIVATRVGGIPELVIDGETGYLVERCDSETASNKVLSLLRDPQRRRSMGQKGRSTVGTYFDLRKNVAQLLEAYGMRE